MRTKPRHRHLRQAERIVGLDPARRKAAAVDMLMQLRGEARRRARFLDAPAVWELARDPRVRAMVRRLDPSGELQADLDRVCADAVSTMAARRLTPSPRRSVPQTA